MLPSGDSMNSLNEADLRRRILRPLFVAMGFKEVIEFHGPEEYGKDFLMWKPDVIRGRENYAVVAKAAKIDSSNRDGLLSQIQQCFGEPFPDPITGDESRVNRVIVVSSKKITPHSKKAIRAALKTAQLDERVDFLDGELLEQRADEYLFRPGMRNPAQDVDPDVLAGRYEALVDPDWREANQTFWEEMRELADKLTRDGRFGGSIHGYERGRVCDRDLKRRADLLIQRAREVVEAARGTEIKEVGERMRRSALQRIEQHIEDIEEKLDDSSHVGRRFSLGRPDLRRPEVLSALDARFFVLLGSCSSLNE